jgi:hypothetical protein
MDRIVLRQRITARLDQLVEKAFASQNPPRTMEEVETLALQLGRQAQAEIAEELAAAAQENAAVETQVQSSAWARPAPKQVCTCQGRARYKGERVHTLVTLAATLEVRRSYYYCRRCDRGFCPVDGVLGLSGSAFTRRVQQEVARLAGLLPYQQAVDLLWELTGVGVSAKHTQRLVGDTSEVLEAFLR